VALLVAAAALAGATAAAAGTAAPQLRSITVQPGGPAQRTVTISTAGPRFRAIYVCDLVTPGCVRAHRAAPHVWWASLPAADPGSGFNIGVYARRGGRYVTAQVGDAPAANVTPHNGI
jgi:hypothetical protein